MCIDVWSIKQPLELVGYILVVPNRINTNTRKMPTLVLQELIYPNTISIVMHLPYEMPSHAAYRKRSECFRRIGWMERSIAPQTIHTHTQTYSKRATADRRWWATFQTCARNARSRAHTSRNVFFHIVWVCVRYMCVDVHAHMIMTMTMMLLMRLCTFAQRSTEWSEVVYTLSLCHTDHTALCVRLIDQRITIRLCWVFIAFGKQISLYAQSVHPYNGKTYARHNGNNGSYRRARWESIRSARMVNIVNAHFRQLREIMHQL